MNTPTPEQLAKLPKWAQEYLRDLETRQHINERTIKQLQDTDTKSKIYFEDQVYNSQRSGPDRVIKYVQATGVSFIMNDQKHHNEIRVSLAYDRPGMLDISAGWGLLKIIPNASNCVRVSIEKD